MNQEGCNCKEFCSKENDESKTCSCIEAGTTCGDKCVCATRIKDEDGKVNCKCMNRQECDCKEFCSKENDDSKACSCIEAGTTCGDKCACATGLTDEHGAVICKCMNRQDGSSSKSNVLKVLGVAAVAGGLGVVAAPLLLGAAGFGATGVVAGSAAAGIQSAVYGAATGGVFSAFQSAGAAGIGMATNAGIFSVSGLFGGAVATKFSKK